MSDGTSTPTTRAAENDTLRLAVTGATGQMGRAVLDAASDREELSVVLRVNRDPDPEGSDDFPEPVDPAADLSRLLDERSPDVLVDFTGPDSAIEYAETCANSGVAFVSGTTGFDDAQLERLREAGKKTPLLHATNFSRGIEALSGALEDVLGALPGYDVELTETHHNRKRDAPSGTANTLLDRIEASRENQTGTDAKRGMNERTYGREGAQPREGGEIGVHVRRAGDVRGEHEVLLAGNDEVLSLTHRAESRAVFAAGALDAARWLASREPGRYEFGEVLA
ncbi:4-hydroxy-tetrahydrodipicolinate reductase [Halobacteriales archaeon QS_3_64_16]|nr:MAG: 4-hydroxy-tetrahydrodipicolinate reductase [Halobacteriales archaeon QS_3_64_16]